MASLMGSAASPSSWIQQKNSAKKREMIKNGKNNKKKFRVSCVSSSAGKDPYKTLRIERGASESEVKKAFRQLALKYHPDVCKESNSDMQFHEINEAYHMVMNNLKTGEASEKGEVKNEEGIIDHTMGGKYDPDDLWEEWMGWEGATPTPDYTSHINPYI